MASRPGITYSIVDTPQTRGVSTDTGVGYMIGVTEQGAHDTNTAVRSVAEYVATFGARVSYSYLYDAVECFFTQGGSLLYISRLIGPDPVYATVNIYDQSGSVAPGDVALVATAKQYGQFANDITVEIEAGGGGGTFVIVVVYDGVEVERSGDLVDRAAAVTWSATSDYIGITLGASAEDPRVQPATALAGGTDDYSNITSTEVDAALANFALVAGPGQVAAPGITDADTHEALTAYCSTTVNRRAIIDLPDTGVVADLVEDAEAITALEGSRYSAGWGGTWLTIPGLTSGTTRTVPPSGVMMGLMARTDGTAGPGQAAAGVWALPRAGSVLGLTREFTDAEVTTLNAANVNVWRTIATTPQNYGFRTLGDGSALPQWQQLQASRVVMAVAAKAQAVLNTYLFASFDGQRKRLAALEGDIKGQALAPYYPSALYGDTAEAAYRVDATSEAVNSDADLADGDVAVQISLRPSPHAEMITATISSQSIATPLA